MVERSLKIYQGEDLSPVTDLTEWLKWEEAEFGTRAYRGEATNSNVVIRDEDGRTGSGASLPANLTPAISLASGNVLEYVHGSNVRWRGRMTTKDYTRGAQEVGRYREVSAYLEDINVDLRNIVVHGWNRPAETDVARIQALIAVYLRGNPRKTTIINGSNLVNAGSNTVNLPAKIYDQTDPQGVIEDIAQQAAKTYHLLPRRRTTDTHTAELFYDGNDAIMERCPYTISDRPEEVEGNNHYFYPIWNVGPASTENGQELISGVYLFYGETSYVHVSDPVRANQYAWREIVIHDGSIETSAEALSRARAVLNERKNEERTYNVTIGPLTDEQLGTIRAGQTIAIKARAIPDADDAYVDRKISQLKETSPNPGTHFVHLQLDRPTRLERHGSGSSGPKPPAGGTTGTPGTVSSAEGLGNTGDEQASVEVASAGGLIAVMISSETMATPTVTWKPNESNGAQDQVMSIIGTVVHPTGSAGSNKDGEKLWVAWVANPNDSTAFDPVIEWTGSNLEFGTVKGYWAVSSSTEPIVYGNSGTGSLSSVTPTAIPGDLVLDCAGYRYWTLGNASNTPTPQSGQTQNWAVAFNNSAARNDSAWGGGNSTGPGSRAWSLGLSTNWVAAAIVFDGGGTAGDSTQPLGGEGEGTVGTDTDHYAPLDHIHEHGDLSDHPDETHHHASSIEYTPTGSIEASNVQDAIAEVAAEAGATSTDLSMGTAGNVTTTGTPAFLHFPGIAKLDADHLLLVYRQATDHASTDDGKIVYKIGTIGTNFAVTWGSQSDVIDGALDYRDPEVTVLSDGTPIASYFTWDGSTAYNIQTVTGSWDGSTLTWDTPVSVTTSFTAEACTAKVVELFNGDLILPIYGHNGGAHTAALVRSTDVGVTWGSQTTIVTGTHGDGTNWTEPYAVRLADGRLHCLVREDTDGVIYRTVSEDGGATWSEPTVAYSGDARPAHIQVQSGGLLLVSRATPNGDTIYRESSDYGLTWTDETVVDATGTRNEYASIVQIDPYRYGVAYAFDNSTTDADVKFVIFTDAANLDIIARLGAASAAAAGASALNDLTDVTIGSPSDGQVLTYDSGTSEWVNENASSGFSNPMTTQGDIISGGASGAAGRLAIGTAGQVLKVNAGATAPEWGTDNSGGTPTFTGCKAYNDAVQSIPDNTLTALTFNTEDYDSDTLHSTSSNTSRITVNETGIWRFTYHTFWSTASATGIRVGQLRIDGTTLIEGSDHRVVGSTAINVVNANTADVELTSGQYVEVMVFQNRGGGTALDCGFAVASNRAAVCSFSAHFLGAP